MLDLVTLTLFIFVFVIAGYFWWENSEYVRTIDRIPGPPKLPIVGNILSVPRNGSAFLKTTQRLWPQKYGPIFRGWRGMFNPNVLICSPEYIEIILSSQKHIEKGEEYKFIKSWLGDGLLLSSGAKWKRDRRLLTPTFHFQILDGFFDTFNRHANILNELIKTKLLELEADDDVQEIDVYPMLSLCTLDIICEAAMGVSIDAQYKNSEYSLAIARMMPMFMERGTSLWGFVPDWIYATSSGGQRFHKCLDTIHEFTFKILQEKKAARQNSITAAEKDADETMGLKKRKAFLDLLLDSADGADMTEKDILDQVDTFMFAGHDTTSVALTWVLYCLATNPDEQDKVYEELRDCFGDSDRPCTMEDMSQMKYMECCIKEAMRLHPSVTNIRRNIKEEVSIGGYKIPAGTTIGISIFALHHNPDLYPEPDTFKPERFQADQSAGRHPYAFIPFSAGPRNCIGQKYANYEEKLILSSLIRKFKFSFDINRSPVEETQQVVLKPVGGMPLIISRR